MPQECLPLRSAALNALITSNFEQKCLSVQSFSTHSAIFFENSVEDEKRLLAQASSAPLPGRLTKPLLVHPMQVPKRSIHTREGRAALIHSIAHIEYNAINLALDAIWRFGGMPEPYYRDWARVAAEEAKHFGLLRSLLREMGHDYGDFPAHDGLWEMTEKTSDDITARMALVPRTLEARGLDATPLIQAKLRKLAEQAAAKPSKADPHAAADCTQAIAILDVILADEIGHVAIGNHWYRWLCERDGLDPIQHYATLSERYQAPKLKAPFNLDARAQAGFLAEELLALGQFGFTAGAYPSDDEPQLGAAIRAKALQ